VKLSIQQCWLALGAALLLHPSAALACAACYGASDSPMASGMNWGIFSLLGVIVSVLGGVASFFIYLARKSAKIAATASAQSTPAPTADLPAAPQPQPS
jgi:hypothetical protein